MIYFTSDLHFSHKNIIKFCPTFRPKDINLMNEFLINQWNSVVSDDDVVYNLGDVSFSHHKQEILDVLLQLKGTHHLILGNHDDVIRQNTQTFLTTKKACGKPALSSITEYGKIRLNQDKYKRTLILSHYPMIEWEGCHKGWYHLYGHLHDRLAAVKGRALNVGFDLHGRLLSLDDIDNFLANLPLVNHFNVDEMPLTSPDCDKTAKQIKNWLAMMNAEQSVIV